MTPRPRHATRTKVRREPRRDARSASTRLRDERLSRLGRLLGQSHDAVIVRDSEGRITAWNAAAAALYGYSATEAIGRHFDDLLQAPLPAEAERALAETGRWTGRVTRRGQGGRVVVVDARLAIVRERGRRFIVEHAGDLSAADARMRLRRLVDQLGGEIVNHEEFTQTIERFCLGVAEFFAADAVSFMEIDDHAGTMAAIAGLRAQDVTPGGEERPLSAGLPAELAESLRCGRAVSVENADVDPRLTAGRGWLAEAGMASWLMVPMIDRGRLQGALAIGAATPRVWTAEEAERLTMMSARLWLAHANARLLKKLREALAERDQALDRAAATQARLELALDAAKLGIYEWDPETERYVRSEQSRLNWHGVAPGNTPEAWELVLPEDREGLRVARAAGLASGKPFHLEYRFRDAQGGIHWLGTWAQLVDLPGAGKRTIGVDQDLTALREAEQHNRETDARIRRLFEADFYGVHFWDEHGRIFEANDAFLRMLGYSRADLEAGLLSVGQITPADWRERDALSMADLRRSGSSGPFEKVYVRADGTRLPVQVAATRFSPPGRGGITVVFDLTERKAQERREQEFLAHVAHDLKNPVAAGKAQTQLLRFRLQRGPVEAEELIEGLELIDRSAVRLTERIDELAESARLRSGAALTLNRRETDLGALVTAIGAQYERVSSGHQIQLTIEGDSVAGLWDPERIERVVDNVLSNAVKYSPAGGPIEVTIRCGGQMAEVVVRDHGVGIPAADLLHVFERYWRAGNVREQFAGTGLGLSGSLQLVEAHGGTMAVASEEGAGTTVTIRLPLWVDETEGHAPAPAIRAAERMEA